MAQSNLRRKATKLSLLQRFGLFFYSHFKTTLILWSVLVFSGVLCYTTLLKREGFPAVAPPISTINGTYFVNDSAKVNAEVSQPLYRIISKRSDVKHVNSISNPNFYVVRIEYKDGTNATTANAELKAAVEQSGVLPKTATAEYKPFLFGLTNDGDDLLISLYSTKPVSQQELALRATAAERLLASDENLKDLVEKVHVLNQFKSAIDPRTGKQITVAESFDRFASGPSPSLYPAVTIAIATKKTTSDLVLYDKTAEALRGIRDNPDLRGYDMNISGDYAEGIRAQTGSLQENLLGGLIAVIAISFLLISLRASFVTAASMASVLAITLLILYGLGLTLNTVTLFALILCLGLIVDDTTIMVEALDAGQMNSRPRHQIVSTAIKKVARASTAGTLTTMLAFAPMLFISGILGEFIHAIPITIIVSLAISLLISLSFIPFMAHFLVKAKQKGISRSAGFSPLKGIESFISDGLAKLIWSGKKSKLRLGVIGSLCIALSIGMTLYGMFMFSRIKFNIFPSTKDTNTMLVTVVTPPTSTLENTAKVTDEVYEIVAKAIGSNIRRATVQSTGSANGSAITIDLVSYRNRDIKAPALVASATAALQNYSKAQVKVRQVDVGPPAGQFGARVFYTEGQVKQAVQLANDIKAYVTNLSLTRADGSVARTDTATIFGAPGITSLDGRTFIEVQAGFDADDTSTLVSLTKNKVEKQFPNTKISSYGLPASALAYDFGSESQNQESFKTMLIAFPVLIIVMFILLALQFKSLLQPFLIFLAIPFSLFGISVGLYLTDNPFSFFTLIGVFALIGISVNNTILLTDYANQAKKEGAGSTESAAVAIKERFRPLITTSLTSIVALIPLAISDPFWESLAVTLIFGLLSSTFLVVVAYPYYYLASEYGRNTFRWYLVLGWIGLLGAGIYIASRDATVGGYIVTVGCIAPIMWTLYKKTLHRFTTG